MEGIKREPDPPYDLQLMQQAKGDVLEVGWLAPYDNGLAVTQFTIYTNATADARVQDSGPFTLASVADSYFSQLTPNTPYLFEVTASNSGGESLRYPGIPSEDPRSFGDKPYYLIEAGAYCYSRACANSGGSEAEDRDTNLNKGTGTEAECQNNVATLDECAARVNRQSRVFCARRSIDARVDTHRIRVHDGDAEIAKHGAHGGLSHADGPGESESLGRIVRRVRRHVRGASSFCGRARG